MRSRPPLPVPLAIGLLFFPAFANAQQSPRSVAQSAEVALGTPPPPVVPTTPESSSSVPAYILGDALRELDRQSLSLQVAQARAAAAKGVVRQAQAALLPSLGATGGYTRNNDEVSISLGAIAAQFPGAPDLGTIVIQPLDAWTVSGALRVPLIVPHAWYDLQAARAAQNAAGLSTQVVRRETHALFSNLAYGAAALEEVVEAAERAIELADAQVKSAERRVRAGTAAPLDVLRAKSERVRRGSDLVRAQAERDRARLALGVLLGKKGEIRVITSAPDVGAAGHRGSTARRAEVQMLEARAEAERAQLSSAKSRVLPELSATAVIFASDEPYMTGENYGWKLGVELSIPLYDGGYRYGKRHEAEANLRATAAELEVNRLSVSQELTNARRDVSVAQERLRLAESLQKLATDAAGSARRSFDAGVATTLDVLDANDKLFQSEVAMAEAKAKVAQALVEVERTLGAPR